MRSIKKTSEKIMFEIKTNETLANSIRRSVALIPTMAVDEVEISRNDSALYDETLAHRLGLVPIKMNNSWKEDTVLKFKFESKKEGPVYSGELKGDFEVVYENIPITLLNVGQEIKIKGKTKIGTGKEHVKFSPGVLFYRDVDEITMDKSFQKEFEEVFDNEVKVKGNKIMVKDNQEKSIVDFCEGLAQKNKKDIEVKETGDFIFTIESFGHLKPEDIFKKSIDIIKKDLKEISKALK